MVRAIISWSLHNRFIVLLGVAALIASGIYSAMNLDVEAYPDPTPPLVEVISQNPGASPEEMERLVGIPIETALNGMKGLKYIRSTSLAGLNDIKCVFEYGTDYWAARQEVINRLGSIDNLPEGVTPELSPWSPTGEIVRYVLEGPSYTLNQIKGVQDWVLERALKTVPGVIDVTGFGGTVKQYQVLVDPRLLRQYNVTMEQVEEAIIRSNANVGGDVLTLGGQAHNVRVIGLLGKGIDPLDPVNAHRASEIELEKLDDLNRVVITSRDGEPVFLRQVASSVVGSRPRLGIVGRGDDNDVVEGIVMMRKGEKSLPTAKAIRDKLEEIEREKLLPEGMSIKVFNQRTDLVNVTTHNVLHNLVLGMTFVVVVLFIFLGDLASAGIVAIMIPLALLFSITVLYVRGESANLLSIGAVDFGIIVDSSVIIVENIYRHITAPGADRSRPLIDRIIDASNEIERPLFFSTTIIICAFIPLFAMSGPEGALFGPMAHTYAFAIFGALMLALTLAPVLCSFFFKHKTHEAETFVDRLMKRRYLRTLNRLLNRRYIAVGAMGALLAATVSLIPGLGGEFMPELEEGNLWIRAVLPRTISLEAAAQVAPELRRTIAESPEVRGVMSQLGRPDDGTDVTSYFNLEFNVPLKPMEEWRPGLTRPKLEEEIAERFKAFPGIDFNFSQLIRDNVDEALSGIKGANSIKIFGNDMHTLEEIGHRVVGILQSVPGIEDVGLFHIMGQPNLEIEIDRDACARHGINIYDVEKAVQVAIGGQAFSQMVEGEKLYDIVLRLPHQLRDDPEIISRLMIEVPGRDDELGYQVPLAQLATISPHKSGASFIYREDNRRYIPIKFSVRGRDLASTIAEAQAKVDDPDHGAQLPRGYSTLWSGEFAQMQQANARLLWIVPLSIGLIISLLYIAFHSLKDALLIMTNVVAATMGGIWALKLTGTPFSISAAVGFISIFGVAVQDGVILVSYFNQMRASGLKVREAILHGAELRVRPLVMTSLTAALGLLPAALATSIGSQAQKPLAIVVVGSMMATLLLTRYLMPILYSFLPAPISHERSHEAAALIEGSHFATEILQTDYCPPLPEAADPSEGR